MATNDFQTGESYKTSDSSSSFGFQRDCSAFVVVVVALVVVVFVVVVVAAFYLALKM